MAKGSDPFIKNVFCANTSVQTDLITEKNAGANIKLNNKVNIQDINFSLEMVGNDPKIILAPGDFFLFDRVEYAKFHLLVKQKELTKLQSLLISKFCALRMPKTF